MDELNVANTNPVSFTIESDTIILQPLEANGYAFDGWYVGDTKVEQIDKGTFSNITLTAKWTSLCEHTFSDWQQTTPATCTTDGEKQRTCSLCGFVDKQTIDALGHSPKEAAEEDVVSATCTQEGSCNMVVCCKTCNVVISTTPQTIQKKDHTFGEWIAQIDETCTQDGVVGHYICSTCGKNFNKNQIELSDLKITSTGHNFESGICKVCGAKQASEGLSYELSADETYYIVSGIGTCADTDIVIPTSYNNLPVKEIGNYAFNNCSSLTSIVIPSSVTSIGSAAFGGCNSLTIYSESESQPSGLNSNRNYSNRPVVWGYTKES